MIKNLPTIQETWVPSLGWENPLEKGLATYFSIVSGEFYGMRGLVGYNPWGCKESDTTEQQHFNFLFFFFPTKCKKKIQDILYCLFWKIIMITMIYYGNYQQYIISLYSIFFCLYSILDYYFMEPKMAVQMAANEACYHVVSGYILYKNYDKAFDRKTLRTLIYVSKSHMVL